jgi:hypothetical protein
MSTGRNERVRPMLLRRAVATTAGVALAFGLGPDVTSANQVASSAGGSTVSASAEGVTRDVGSMAVVPPSVSTPIRRAGTALNNAMGHISTHHYGKAVASLRTLRRQVSKAHAAGVAQIGKPPSDPESDDPPGPPSVLAVLGLEHRVAMKLVPRFDRMTNRSVVDALRSALWLTHYRRDNMLDAVIALPDEGEGSLYSDGMADTVGLYAQEVTQLTTAVNTYRLTPRGETGVRRGLTRARATKTKVDRAFGGGE